MDSSTSKPELTSTVSTASSNYKTRSSTKRTASILDTAGSRISTASSVFSFSHHSTVLNSTKGEIREGRDFQVPVEGVGEWERRHQKPVEEEGVEGAGEEEEEEREEEEKDTCLWGPQWERLDDKALMAYCTRANQIYGINPDRALLMLYHANYDLSAAERKLQSIRPIDPLAFFTDDDTYLFRCAIAKYGKHFSKIHQMLPHKSIPALVEFYYATKKRQNYASQVDNERVETDSSDDEDLPKTVKPVAVLKRDGMICENCRQVVRHVFNINELEVCTTCKLYFKATNQHRVGVPTSATGGEQRRPHLICPPDMQEIAQQFVDFAQPAESESFEDADDSGDLQIASHPKITHCKMEISKTHHEMDKIANEAKQIEDIAREELRRMNSGGSAATLMQQVLTDAKEFLKRTSPGSSGAALGGPTPLAPNGIGTSGTGQPQATGTQPQQQKSNRLNYSWSNFEQEACFFALVRFGLTDLHVAASICNKTVDMVKRFYQENKKTIDETIENRQRYVREQAEEMSWAEELRKIRDEQMDGYGNESAAEDETDIVNLD